MLKGGVFGFGGVGQHMTRRINQSKEYGGDFRIVAICNRGKEKRDLAEKEYGLKAYEKLDDLIAHGLDFMLILSTSHVHREAAVKCAEAGIPFLIEKPIALTVEDAWDIVNATEKAGVINGVNYSMRYNPTYIKMKDMVDKGELGRVMSIWARSFRGHGFYEAGKRHRAVVEPEESGGWIVHHMCHIVDFVIWLGGEIDEVYTITQTTAPPELDSEELVYSTVKFKSGAIGMVSDVTGYPSDHSAGVSGTKGGVTEYLNGPKPLIKLYWETDREFGPPHIIDPQDSVKREDGLSQFLRCLKEGKPTNVPVREAWYSLKVCHAMRRSAHEGKPVKID
jgi:predicted dehydrogenase